MLRIAGSPKNSLLNPYPVALDRGEHRVGVVGQSAGADHADGLRDDLADALADAERGDRERYKHVPTLAVASGARRAANDVIG